jgi:hypothetical protein
MNAFQRGAVPAALLAALLAAPLANAGTVIRFNDYDGGLYNDPAYPFTGSVGAAVPVPVQGYAGIGVGSNAFAGNLLWDNGGPGDSGIGGSFSNLPAGGTVSLSFLFAALDGWAGNNVAKGGPDRLQLLVDGQVVWSTAISNYTLTSSNGGTLLGSGYFGGNPRMVDSAWDFSDVAALQNIHYSGTSLSFGLRAAGDGWTGGPTETWGIDNIQVTLNAPPVPEPESDMLMGAGVVALAAWLAVRRRQWG